MKRKFLIILLAIVCAFYCVAMFSACGDKGNVNDTGNNSSVTDQTGDSNDDGSGENSETPETPENPESGDENNDNPTTPDTPAGDDNPTTPNTPEDDGKGDTGNTDSDTGETGKPESPDAGDAEEKQDEYIYTKENGWNTQLLAKTLENWMIENDYYQLISPNSNYFMKKMLFAEDNPNLDFCCLCYKNNKPVLHYLDFRPSFEEEVKEKYNKKEDLVKALDDTLNSIMKQLLLGKEIQLEYSSLDDDFDIHREEFETLTSSVISRLSGEGAINNSDIFSDIFENSQIIYGFKTNAGRKDIGAGLGNFKEWQQIYIIKKDNKYQFVEVFIASSIDGEIFGYGVDEKQYVLENADDTKWIVSKLTSKEVLFVDNSK